MTDNESQRAREWLERQMAELAQLRNANRRDPVFKSWRQQTATVIQRIWPNDPRRADRFRRIPFTPPMPKPSDRQVREHYERGWGEAGVLLREMLTEVNLHGAPRADSRGADPTPPPLPVLKIEPEGDAVAPESSTEAPASAAPDDPAAADEIGRAMEQWMQRSPVFRGGPRTPRTGIAEPGPAVAEPPASADLARVADELDALGVPPTRAAEIRRSLLALARATRSGPPGWDLVADALEHSGASPALARRLLPLLLPFTERAA